MVGAAAMAAAWVAIRGDFKMSKGKAVNGVVLIAAVAVVAGVAWFKSNRQDALDTSSAATGLPAVPAVPDTLSETPESVVHEGELCPEPPPTAPREDKVATASSSGAATRPAAKIPRLVDVGADWCKSCRALAPILDALREEYKGRLDVEFIHVHKNRSARKLYSIRVIPTQILFDKDGNEVWRHEGFISKEDLKVLFAEKVGVK